MQKCTTTICILAYESLVDSVDEYVRVVECTTIQCFEAFVKGVNQMFGDAYLGRPNNNDINCLLQIGEVRGFPSMLDSIDCMHWKWKSCPIAWQGQYRRGDHCKPTIILEVVTSQDLWIRHAYYGVTGSSNDINVLNQSPVFNDVLQGRVHLVQFIINETPYNIRYYLANGVYRD